MALGVIHPDILEGMLSQKQITELEIYSTLEPIGEHAEWIRTAILACILVNANLGKGKKRAQMKDFMPEYFFEKKKQQSLMEMMGTMNLIMKKQQGKKKEKKPRK